MNDRPLLDIERDRLLLELKQALLGIPHTEEKGISGDVREIKEHLIVLNSSVAKNTTWRKIITAVGGIFLTAVATKLQGLW